MSCANISKPFIDYVADMGCHRLGGTYFLDKDSVKVVKCRVFADYIGQPVYASAKISFDCCK